MMMISNVQWQPLDLSWPETLPHTWQVDDRSPILTFHVNDTMYGLFSFSIYFWIFELSLVIFESIIALPCAWILYTFVIKRQKQLHGSKRRMGTTTFGYFLGWCVLLPTWIVLPGLLCNMVHISNIILRFCVCVITPTVSIFRTLEAIYGFYPTHSIVNLRTYLLYFCFPLTLKYDPKTDKAIVATYRDLLTKLLTFLTMLFVTGLYQNLFVLLDGLPTYGSGPGTTPDGYHEISSIFNVNIWMDTILMAVLFQLYLTLFSEGLALVTMLLTGKQTEMFMDNPIFASTSPSDFWGKRWNLLIHRCLKNGVFKPVRALGGSRGLAVLAVFAASGLFHEWLLPNVFYTYPNTHGPTLLFFMWQAMLIVLEVLTSSWSAKLAKKLPASVRTALIILAGLPPAHWFCDSYWHSDFFIHGQIVLPMILPIMGNESGSMG